MMEEFERREEKRDGVGQVEREGESRLTTMLMLVLILVLVLMLMLMLMRDDVDRS